MQFQLRNLTSASVFGVCNSRGKGIDRLSETYPPYTHIGTYMYFYYTGQLVNTVTKLILSTLALLMRVSPRHLSQLTALHHTSVFTEILRQCLNCNF